ncbi:MAG: hydantoinase B/oxoprolinase family protein [Martelella sp.]|uniref:hydantoinase B/oxoprolinase family protein n=1 Tax=Martelella sp. TaxID=1969699 RepID=UPI003241BA54
MRSTYDPITLEVYWSRLVAVADEAASTLLRTAFSTIIRESNDYVTCLLNARGETLVECSGGVPTFAGLLGRTTRHLLTIFPVDTWQPGDVVITNDPWIGTGHLPDISVITPVFHLDKLVGFSASAAHTPDIGGTIGSANKEIYEEGLRLPPVHLYRNGRRNEAVFEIISANVRFPDLVLGDLDAQVSANRIGARGATDFLSNTGLPDFAALSREINEMSEAAMRAALQDIPDGVYASTVEVDGYEDQETVIRCAITVAGDDMTIDYAGTSPQIARAINCTLNYTIAYSIYPLKCLLDPHTRRNEGSYRPITVTAPEGAIVNARFPAAVAARHLTGHLLSCAIYQALAPVLPERVVADSGGAPSLRVRFYGKHADGRDFGVMLFASAGMGASAQMDGLSTTAFPTNSGAGSIEAIEAISPLVFTRKMFRPDSGGVGRFRGGLGQVCEVRNNSPYPCQVIIVGDRERHPPLGLLGGGPGAPAAAIIDGEKRISLKSRNTLAPGSCLALHFAGGGGYGDPLSRERGAVERDLTEGKITRQAAQSAYGLYIKEDGA